MVKQDVCVEEQQGLFVDLLRPHPARRLREAAFQHPTSDPIPAPRGSKVVDDELAMVLVAAVRRSRIGDHTIVTRRGTALALQ